MADTAQGTRFQVGDAATPELFTDLAGVKKIGGVSLSNPTIDATDLLDSARQKISAKLCECGPVALDLHFDALSTGDQDALVDKIIAGGGQSNYVICWSNLDANTTAISVVDTVNDELDTVAAHGWHTGQPIRFTTDGTLPTSTPQIVVGTTYFAGYIDADSITVHLTNADAVAGANKIDFTAAGVSNNNVTFGTVWSFAALVQSATPSGDSGDALAATLNFEISDTVGITG